MCGASGVRREGVVVFLGGCSALCVCVASGGGGGGMRWGGLLFWGEAGSAFGGGLRECRARSAKFWMSANTCTLATFWW